MINIYSKPTAISLVDRLYVPPVEMLGKALEVKQQAYDKNMAEALSFEGLADKVKAVGYHRQLADAVVQSHQEDLYNAVDKAKGDYSIITPQLIKAKRNIMRDMGPNGVLGKINAYAQYTDEWDKTYKNDKNDQFLYSYFKNKIYSDTKLDAMSYAQSKDFNIDMGRFESIPENYQTAFKGIVDLASKYQITEGKYYSAPVQDPTTGQYIVQEVETKDRGGNDFKTTISNLMALDPTINQTLQKYEKIKPGAGVQLGNSLVNNAYNLLRVEQKKEDRSTFFVPEHLSDKEGKKAEGPYGATQQVNVGAEKTPFNSQALGTSSVIDKMFGSNLDSPKAAIDNIKASIVSTLGVDHNADPSLMKLFTELDKFTTEPYQQVWKQQGKDKYLSKVKSILYPPNGQGLLRSYDRKDVYAQVPLTGKGEKAIRNVLAVLDADAEVKEATTGTKYKLDAADREAIQKGTYPVIHIPLGAATNAGLGFIKDGKTYVSNVATLPEEMAANERDFGTVKKYGFNVRTNPVDNSKYIMYYDRPAGQYATILNKQEGSKFLNNLAKNIGSYSGEKYNYYKEQIEEYTK